MTTKILIPSIADLDKAAHEFVELMDDATVFAFYGEMGADIRELPDGSRELTITSPEQ